ncbi:MAG TPA: glycosyltransferase family 87 protein [Vicinamibacteria bacterium]|nr:glycosyltransferase family 87 protein [Vicinamibacteria bacterium]
MVLISTVALCLHTTLVKRPANYRVVTGAGWNIVSGDNPYAPELGLDRFKYSPLAGLLTIPFAQLPREGLFLFLLTQCALFFWGFPRWSRAAGYSLGLSSKLKWVALGSIALDLAVAIQNAQVNLGIFGLMLLGAAQYAEGKCFRSGLVLSLATNLKLFPFTLVLCLLTSWNAHFWVSVVGGTLAWFLLPAALLGIERNLELHRQWMQLMWRDEDRPFIMLDIGSFLERHFGIDGAIRYPVGVAVGIAIGIGCLVLFRRGERERLHRFLLPINGLYVLLFSYLSESPTSVLAVAGIFLIGATAVEKSGERIYWAAWVLALVLVPGLYSDFAPPHIEAWARAIHLKTVGYLYVTTMLLILFRASRMSPGGPSSDRMGER